MLGIRSRISTSYPIRVGWELKAAIDARGPVRFVVAPSLYHHLFVGSATDAWPDARVLAPARLRKERPDLRIDADLEAGAPSAWDGSLELFPIRGSMLGETALYHRSSKTLVGSDLFENFTHAEHWVTRGYLKLGGIYGKPGWHRLLRSVYRDRKAARASIEALLELDFEAIIIAHGDIVTARARETLQEALAFLLHRGERPPDTRHKCSRKSFLGWPTDLGGGGSSSSAGPA